MIKREFLKLSSTLILGSTALPALISCSSNGGNHNKREPDASSGIGELSLPDIPYDYGSLAPIIDEKTMRIHHGKHHAGYTKKANKALKALNLKNKPLSYILENLSDEFLRNNLGGFLNHELFWTIMTPGGKMPSKKMKSAMEENFGSMQAFTEKFQAAANGVFGSGWAWLVKKDDGSLAISTTENQDNPMMTSKVDIVGRPILGIDVWEHAYYLNYQNMRKNYVEGFMSIINWGQVEDYFNLK